MAFDAVLHGFGVLLDGSFGAEATPEALPERLTPVSHPTRLRSAARWSSSLGGSIKSGPGPKSCIRKLNKSFKRL